MGIPFCQPKNITITQKQLQTACWKARVHLEINRNRKNGQIVNGEKELVTKVKSAHRNKQQEVAKMKQILNNLKKNLATNQLISYANILKERSAYIVDNQKNHEELEDYNPALYSLLYSADKMGLSSLNEFKVVVEALSNEEFQELYTSRDIKELLTEDPTHYELNLYVLEMTQRNNITLEKINEAGHNFTYEPQPPRSQGAPRYLDSIGVQKDSRQGRKSGFGDPNSRSSQQAGLINSQTQGPITGGRQESMGVASRKSIEPFNPSSPIRASRQSTSSNVGQYPSHFSSRK